MERELNEIKRHIGRLNALLVMYRDEESNTEPFVSFISSLFSIRLPKSHLPLMEIITIIQYQRPRIYHSLKMCLAKEHSNMLEHSSLDVRTAEKNLDNLLLNKTLLS
jgi:hypothetical protein